MFGGIWENFGEILWENWWNFGENSVKFWEYIGEILRKILEKIWKKIGELLWKIWWHLEKNLVKLKEKFGEVLGKILVKFWGNGAQPRQNYPFNQKTLHIKVVDNSTSYKKLGERACVSPPGVEVGGWKDCHVSNNIIMY